MPLRIALPNKEFYSFLTKEYDSLKDTVQLFHCNADEAADLLLSARVDVALLDPLGYGQGLGKADYRILPAGCLAVQSASGLVRILFRSDTNEIKRCAIDVKDNYLRKISQILLQEKFGIEAEFTILKSITEVSLQEFDVVITENRSINSDVALDLTGEWFDLYDIPLPIAFWVCRYDEDNTHILELLEKLAGAFEEVIPTGINDDHNIELYSDDCLFLRRWNEDIANALTFTLDFLYYHQELTEIPDVKLINDDNEGIGLNAEGEIINYQI